MAQLTAPFNNDAKTPHKRHLRANVWYTTLFTVSIETCMCCRGKWGSVRSTGVKRNRVHDPLISSWCPVAMRYRLKHMRFLVHILHLTHQAQGLASWVVRRCIHAFGWSSSPRIAAEAREDGEDVFVFSCICLKICFRLGNNRRNNWAMLGAKQVHTEIK